MKTIMSIIVGIMTGMILVVGGYMIGATLAGEDPIEQIDTVVTMLSHDVENKMEDVKEEVDYQIWRIETTSDIKGSFGDNIAELFWDLTR